MSNKVDPLALFLSGKQTKAKVSKLTLEDLDKIETDTLVEMKESNKKQYAYPAQIEYFKRFEEKGLFQINLFVRKDFRDKLTHASSMIKEELVKSGRANTKSNRHLIANIIFDFYMANNPNFEESIKNAVFATTKKTD